jgi:hypothetical protein
VIGKCVFDLFSLFGSIHDAHFLFIYCLSVPGMIVVLTEEVTRGRLMPSWWSVL